MCKSNQNARFLFFYYQLYFRRSIKKGLVIPNWPRHVCHDFEAFKTSSWWYNYHTYEDVTDIRLEQHLHWFSEM